AADGSSDQAGGGRGADSGAVLTVNSCGVTRTGRGGGTAPSFGVVDLNAKSTRVIADNNVTMSADGRRLAWLTRGAEGGPRSASPTLGGEVRTVRSAPRLDAPALSPDGTLVAYQTMMPGGTDWEIFITNQAGIHRRITRDIQHDVLPRS